MNTISVFEYCNKGISLSEACSVAGRVASNESPVAILYAPQKCYLAKLVNGTLTDSSDRPISENSVYEARIFCKSFELRWLNDPSPAKQHRAVIVSEKDLSNALDNGWSPTRQQVVDSQEQTYLLWGQGIKDLGNGWSQIGGARVGAIEVPVANVQPKANVLLESVEYFVESEHGNVIVWAERLKGFQVSHTVRSDAT
jgi:CRISPR-associated protein (TIGR03984 family)